MSIPCELEKRILDVITKDFNERQIDKEVSGRLTNKKLMVRHNRNNLAKGMLRVHTFKYKYLRNKSANFNHIFLEASLGWWIACIRF